MFSTTPEKVVETRSTYELADALEQEAGDVERFPLEELERVTKDSIVAYQGQGKWRVTPAGLAGLCRISGVPKALVVGMRKEGLASEVLTDRLKARAERWGRNAGADLVVDKGLGAVVGVVGRGYATLRNQEVMDGMEETMPKGWGLHEARIEGTNLLVRLGNRNDTWGWADEKDRAWQGIEVRNSMTGDSAVRIAHFVERLVCSNGMTIRTPGKEMRVVHRGNPVVMRVRIAEGLAALRGDGRQIRRWLRELANAKYDPEIIGKTETWAGRLWDSLAPALREGSGASARRHEEKETEAVEALAGLMQGNSGGKPGSALDWINLVTAEARRMQGRERYALEEAAGAHAMELAGEDRRT